MATISRTLARIKQDLQPFVPESMILEACRENEHHWRDRLLGPVATIHLFILQVLHFNTAITHLRHLSGLRFTAAAYCRARQRLPLAVLEKLLRQSAEALRQGTGDAAGLWCGLRAYLVDGSSTITPDTPALQEAFGQPKGQKPGCGFPVPMILGLFDAFSGTVMQMLSFPLYTHEMSRVYLLHPILKAGDLLVGDRGFCSFVHLALLSAAGVQGLFRMHQQQIVNFRPHRRHKRNNRRRKDRGMPTSRFIRRLGKRDQIVAWNKPPVCPKWMDPQQFEQLPEELQVRELRFCLPSRGQRTRVVIIATTLLDPVLYPKQKIEQLYAVRWQVETHFAEMKTTLRMRKIKCQSVEGVKKELAVYGLVYNLVRAVMLAAAARQRTTPDRISFIDTLRWLLSAAPSEPPPNLLINPYRPDRHEPRVTKDREDTYTKMTRPRAELRKELKMQRNGLK
jgi:hypothetical protein